jgi:uncharacterized protein with HEPN domain
MSKHDPRLTLQQLRDAAREAAAMCGGLTPEALCADRMRTLAVERCFEIIGEAVKRLPPDLCARYPQVPWKKVSGVRDRVVHGYDDIEHQVLLDAVRLQFPLLLTAVAQMLTDLPPLPAEETEP